MSARHSSRRNILIAGIVVSTIALVVSSVLLFSILRDRDTFFPRDSGRPLNIILVSLDTTRPDRLAACGGSPVATPALDRVRGDGWVFSQMISPAPNTLPAHASLFTGQNPYVHGVRENTEHELPRDASTLAAVLRAAGYETAAFIASFVLDRRFGLDQGFALYDDRMWGPEPGLSPYGVELRGEIVARRAATWLVERRARGSRTPFFLFVHFYDAHAPYSPPEPYASLYPGRPYEGELAYQDACLGLLLDAVEDVGEAANTCLWVVSDHGESLGEHGEATHSLFVYEGAIRVVSILRGPAKDGRYSAGKPRGSVDTATSLISVAPTLLAFVNLADRLNAEGTALSARPKERLEPAIYCETLSPFFSYSWAPLYAVRTRNWKYIRAPQSELYDLAADPDETRNVIAKHPELAADFNTRLDGFLDGAAPAERGARRPNEDEIAKLESLGYVASRGRARQMDLPDPKTMVRFFHDELQRGKSLLYAGQYIEAAEVLAAAFDRDPTNNSLAVYLGTAYREAGRTADAARVFERAVRIQPQSVRAWNGWGRALLALGRPDSSAWAHLCAIELMSAAPEGWLGLGDARWRKGRGREAAAAYDSALVRGADPAHVHGLLARLHRERTGDVAAATRHLTAYARLRNLDESRAEKALPPAP